MSIFTRRRTARPAGVGPREEVDPTWYQPIVIDEPVVEFEPRPPTGSTRPDTTCDAWSTRHFTVRTAAVRGYDHRYRGLPRQDEVLARPHGATQGVVFAVADGVSAAAQAEVGATIACETAAAELIAALDLVPPEQLPWAAILGRICRRLTREAGRRSGLAEPDRDDVERMLATTLVAGVITRSERGNVARLVRIGDSCAWVLRGGRFTPLAQHKTGTPVLSSAVEPLPRVPDDLRPVEVLLPSDGVLVVATDGLGDPLGDGSGLVGRMLATALPVPPSALGLARLLDFSRETFDDDRAAVVIWPISEPGDAT